MAKEAVQEKQEERSVFPASAKAGSHSVGWAYGLMISLAKAMNDPVLPKCLGDEEEIE